MPVSSKSAEKVPIPSKSKKKVPIPSKSEEKRAHFIIGGGKKCPFRPNLKGKSTHFVISLAGKIAHVVKD